VIVVCGERRYADERRFAAVLEMGGADDPAELRPALVVAGQQDEVVAGRGELAAGRGGGEVGRGDARDEGGSGGCRAAGCCGQGVGGHVDDRFDADLDADDGFDAGRPAGLVEAHGAVEAVVVGDRQGRHAQPESGLDELVDTPGAVAEREVGVDVEVDEAHLTPG
jgi:hypothetical protein